MCLLLLLGIALAAETSFLEHTIATDLKGGYQVIAVDLNKDGRQDLIALGTGMTELAWFENPGWKRRVIASGLTRPINASPWDTDGDGVPELVLASEFDMDPPKSAGLVQFLKHRGDPREPWSVTEIDRVPTSHRLRWARIDGSGRRVAINAPLAGAKSAPPDYREKVPLVFYRPASWKRELISEALSGVMHGFTVVDWDGDGRDAILTASFKGIHLFRSDPWRMTELAKGAPGPWPNSGASDIAAGRLGKRRFLATIEPWHGNQVVVYTEEGEGWRRHPIDDSLIHGHALAVGDLDGDGRDEIVAGFRGEKRGVILYTSADAEGRRWSRRVVDGNMAASSCAIADLDGDGRTDIAAIGGSVLKWYENAALP
jgi:hypothetical protein